MHPIGAPHAEREHFTSDARSTRNATKSSRAFEPARPCDLRSAIDFSPGMDGKFRPGRSVEVRRFQRPQCGAQPTLERRYPTDRAGQLQMVGWLRLPNEWLLQTRPIVDARRHEMIATKLTDKKGTS
jgi:hypothetical protein